MYKTRDIHKIIRDHFERKEYIIITGARQVGKTTLLREIYKELKDQNKKVFYLTFENIDVLYEVNKHPENIFRFTQRPVNPLEKIIPLDERIYLLIDEVQYAEDPSGFLKYLYDTYLNHLKIITTGSSAFYIDSKFKDSLAGRKKIFRLNALNFMEYLDFLGRNDLSAELAVIRERKDYISPVRYEIYEKFDEYLVYGGYPAVVLENDIDYKKDILQDLRNSFIKRDILESGIRNEPEFFKLMALLASQTGSLVNKNELSQTLGIHMNTITSYLHLLEKCFYISLVKPFSKNVRKELIKMPKVYFNDPGIRNVLLNRFIQFGKREDKGALLENYAFIRLTEKYKSENIKFWRTASGHEIDFIISDDFVTGKAFEIKFDGRDFKPNKYNRFNENYPGIVLNGVSYDAHEGCIQILSL